MKGTKVYFPFPDWTHTGAKNKCEASANREDKVSFMGMRDRPSNLDRLPNNSVEPFFLILTYNKK